MEYKLAKELKDAGFPVNTTNIDPKTEIWDSRFEGWDAPTLSELIEACGGVMLEGMPEAWSACVYRGTTCVEGTTPEEAVARLWIALNKK